MNLSNELAMILAAAAGAIGTAATAYFRGHSPRGVATAWEKVFDVMNAHINSIEQRVQNLESSVRERETTINALQAYIVRLTNALLDAGAPVPKRKDET